MSYLVTVLGATGKQGNAVALSLLEQPNKFKVRAVTRDPSKDAAQALKKAGAEVVKGDFNSAEDLRAAFTNADAVFALTDPFAASAAVTEAKQGIQIADVAKECGVKHLVFSVLPSPTKLSNGKITGVGHFEDKDKVRDYIIQKLPDLNTTFVECGPYMQNYYGLPVLSPRLVSGVAHFGGICPPSTLMPNVDVADVGPVVTSILSKGPTETKGKTYKVAVLITIEQQTKEYEQVTGQKAVYDVYNEKDYLGTLTPILGESFSGDIYQMFLFLGQYTWIRPEEVESAQKELGVKYTTWKEWLTKSGFKAKE